MPKRQVEVFVAGCPVCEPAVRLIEELACPDCDITVHDMRSSGADLAVRYALKTIPAVVVDGEVVSCCRNAGPEREALAAAGVGQRLSS